MDLRTRVTSRLRWILAGLFLLGVVGLHPLAADDKKPSYPKPPDAKNAKVIPDAWKAAPKTPATPAEIDQLLAKELRAEKLRSSPLTTDEQFIRRATLDLTGKLPLPADVEEFIASREPQKRGKLIDQLLTSKDYADHWARYWRDVVVARATDMRIKRFQGEFEEWLKVQLQANRSWADLARDMLTAKGEFRTDEGSKNGGAFFLLAHQGTDAAVERAAETSRVFLGIQIQCAQCHDHPNDMWKRNQFHELTAFFGRMRERPIRDGNRIMGIDIFSQPREYQMPGQDDPKKTTVMHPRFLLGQSVAPAQGDIERRTALANYVTDKDNYWFAAAYVNRIWGELMGQAFYQPVDHMGPLQEATYPNVLVRLAAGFQATDYDMRALFRVILNSQTYQRQFRIGDSTNEHLHFTAAYPTRLDAGSLWESLVGALGSIQGTAVGMPRQRRQVGPFGLEGMFLQTFEFDPSTKPDEVEGSVPQALMLMNNPAINDRMKASGNTVLARILQSYSQDDEAIKMVYLRTLARKPTNRELDVCLKHLNAVSKRGEAFEDIMWSLINSTEFQTKR